MFLADIVVRCIYTCTIYWYNIYSMHDVHTWFSKDDPCSYIRNEVTTRFPENPHTIGPSHPACSIDKSSSCAFHHLQAIRLPWELLKLIGIFHSSMNSSPHTKPLHLLHKPFTFPSTLGPFTTHPILLLILTKPSSSRRGQITHILEADQEMHLCVLSDFLVRELKDWDFENNPWVWVEMTWTMVGRHNLKISQMERNRPTRSLIRGVYPSLTFVLISVQQHWMVGSICSTSKFTVEFIYYVS